MKYDGYVWLVLMLASLFSGALGQEEEVNLHIGHRHHHHRHGDPHETEPASAERFETNRESAAELRLPKEKDTFTFAVFGDRTGGPVDGVGVLADAVRDVNLLEPDLVMTVGDMIQGYNQGELWTEEMKEYKEIMDQLLCPWFPVAGNHDIYWRGPKEVEKPAGEHEKAYETHFGPLWYAFEHKDCWFIILYSDEGDPETGVKSISRPESQKMSPEQLAWLEETLKKASDAKHVFLFLHHPRWIGGRYGDEWERVHALLKRAGNVSAVFAGHIHQMRYDPRDEIEYVTLATTGGHKPATGKAFGYLHHYDLVRVRPDRIALAAIPVGEVVDVRQLSGEFVAETRRLGSISVPVAPTVVLPEGGAVAEEIEMTVSNPSTRPIEFTLGASGSGGWTISPGHRHGKLEPGASMTLAFALEREAGSIGVDFREPIFGLQIDYLAPGYRYSLPERSVRIPLDLQLSPGREAQPNRALVLDGERDYLALDLAKVEMGEAFTVECWFKARVYGGPTGLVTKTEASEYGLFVSGGRPSFSVHLGTDYLTVEADAPILKTEQWHHMAGVYDGAEVRLYLDGKLIAAAPGEGARTRNTLPLLVGADVRGGERAHWHFAGSVDTVRLSNGGRYDGAEVEVERRWTTDGETCLLLQLDEMLGPWCLDDSESKAHARWKGGPVLEGVGE